MASTANYYCDEGGPVEGGCEGIVCQALDGAPATPGFHPGTWVVVMNNPGGVGVVLECAAGITISQSAGGFDITASSGVTVLA